MSESFLRFAVKLAYPSLFFVFVKGHFDETQLRIADAIENVSISVAMANVIHKKAYDRLVPVPKEMIEDAIKKIHPNYGILEEMGLKKMSVEGLLEKAAKDISQGKVVFKGVEWSTKSYYV